MRMTILVLAVLWSTAVNAKTIASINPCLDDWLPQWLPSTWQVLPTTEHQQRLEAIVLSKPDVIVAGSFVNQQLLLALQDHAEILTLPYVRSMSDWRNAVRQLATELQAASAAEQWLWQQQQELQSYRLDDLGELLVLMPNSYTWGANSWVGQLLHTHGARLSPIAGNGELVRLQLEQLLASEPDTVILEGFSQSYGRSQDWLWHDAVQHWLAQRHVVEVDGDIAGCADYRAVDYLHSITRGGD